MKSSRVQSIAFKILIIVTIIDIVFAIYNIFLGSIKDAILPIGVVPLSIIISLDYYKKNYSKK